MKFRIGAIFSQVGVSFKISYKVIKLIWDELEKRIDLSDIYEKKYPDYALSFLYSARAENDFAIKRSIVSKRYRIVEYVIYMPYKEILSDIELYDIFLTYMEKAMKIIFEQYNINQNELDAIFSDVRKEVIGNPEYII